MLVPVSRGIPGHCSLGDYFKARWTALSSFVGREKQKRREKGGRQKGEGKKEEREDTHQLSSHGEEHEIQTKLWAASALVRDQRPANQRRWNARIQLRVSKESSQAFAINSAGWSATARGVGRAVPTGAQGSRAAPRREVVSAGRPHDLHDLLDL